MSTHRNCQHCGTDEQIYVATTTFVTDVGRVIIVQDEPTDPNIHLAPNHQDYRSNHRKQRRGKFKRGGR